MKPECLNWCYIFNKLNKMSVICKCPKKNPPKQFRNKIKILTSDGKISKEHEGETQNHDFLKGIRNNSSKSNTVID